MRNLKKFLALVLAMMMTLSLMVTVNAAATSNQEFTGEDVTEAFKEDIIVLAGMGVVQGHADTGTFEPKTNVTRAQMATIIYRMVTGDVSNNREPYGAGYGNFKDVKGDEWFAGAVGYCANAGLIVGYPDGNYKPFKNVTGYEALVMILRAMGYNQPGQNFVGSDWAVRALSTATERGMMANIVKTVYNNTYGQAATRELVSEMAFQGMTKPMVRWTGSTYERYGMEGGILSNILNPTLGETYFGLTNHKGIVVGNQSTGEKTTKIGFSMDVSFDKGLNIGDTGTGTNDWTVKGDLASAAINDNISKAAYYYASGLAHNNSGTPVGDYNVTLAFKWDSDLTLFNHAVDVWYDCRANRDTTNETVQVSGTNVSGSVTYPSNLATYAVFDRAVKTKVVVAPDAALNGTVNNDTTVDSLAEAVLNADFTRRTGTDVNKAFFNYAFAPMAAANFDTDTVAGDAFSVPSRIKANNDDINGDGTTTDADWPLYLVISNTPGDVVDVVISLNVTMSKVTQDNNTQAPLTTGIITQNGTGNGYFDLWDQVNPAIGDDYSNIANANLVRGAYNKDYDAKLGDYVAAVTVTGTTPTQNNGVGDATATAGATAAGNATDGNAKAATGMKSTFYYELTQLTEKVSKTVWKYDIKNQDVYCSDGSVLHQSIFAQTTDGSFKAHKYVMAPTDYGTYTFYLDREGNYIFWEEGATPVEFVYGTYVDYESAVLSGGFNYPMLYVNSEGEDQLRENIEKLNMNNYEFVVGTDITYNGDMSGAGYTAIQLPKRTDSPDNSSGFVRGAYMGFAKDGNNFKAIVSDSGDEGTGFMQATTNANDFGANVTTINATSVAIGAHPVANATVAGQPSLFLTERTKFVIVDGAGTATQESTVYNGLTEFLGDNQSVVIDATATADITTAGTKYLAQNAAPYNMVYYSTEENPYSQDYDQMDKHVDTVFIPRDLVEWTAKPASGNMFFVGDSSYNIINEDDDATLFTFYQRGTEQILWIRGQANQAASATNDAEVIKTLGHNVFYQLVDTGKTAHDGEKIYMLDPIDSLDDADEAIIGQYYGSADNAGTAASRTLAAKTTVLADGTTPNDKYLATTRNSQVAYMGTGVDGAVHTADDLYNVANAEVKNLDKAYTINSLGDLNDQSALASNQGVAVSCMLEKAKTVDFIYVNYAP